MRRLALGRDGAGKHGESLLGEAGDSFRGGGSAKGEGWILCKRTPDPVGLSI
ncbi:hypothetical protein ACL02P_20655 [Paenibacillus sp. MB22_1]|uniref:hypothetical protein n=1 Tax=unclassified Paenibacillus TaxID=185978 RepID=UPI0012F94AEF|nr:hypothetical protein [Paenibacillus sp. p3-SID1389]MCT2196403.1 hypothetical protein [Paenibacillus sp. p3-SID1389]